tara:strand:- start:2624 stop:3313 length:690 start_codon:yes stop_codon:yes gene_type:complete
MKTAVLLSGCGVYDGSEIHESVLSLLSLSQRNLEFICTAPNMKQHHVINHINGEEMNEDRNILLESARIARGDILPLNKLDKDYISSLLIPGGFGAAKNLSNWAFEGPKGQVNQDVKDLILHCIEHKKPIVTLCISPTLIAKSLEGSSYKAQLTLGSTKEKSEYNIAEINQAISSTGSTVYDKDINEICFDEDLKIISAPCYMMDAKIDDIYNNITMAVDKLSVLLKKK